MHLVCEWVNEWVYLTWMGVMKQSWSTYFSVGIAASYFADRICEAALSELVLSWFPCQALLYLVASKYSWNHFIS